MKKITFLFFLSLWVFSLSAQGNIQWRNDRTGIYNETGLLKSWGADGPQMLWHYNGLGVGHSSVAIANNKIYTTGLAEGKGYLFVFDMSGKLLNKKEYGTEWDVSYNGSRGTVTINEGKVYIISGTGNVICLNEKTLDIIWQKDFLKDFDANNIKWGINESPLIVGEKLILTPGGKENNVVALNKNTGALIWSSKGEGGVAAYCSPIYLSDQQVPQVVTLTSTHIMGVDIATGKLIWSYEYKSQRSIHPNSPVYHKNMLLCTVGYGKGSVMLRLTNGGRNVEKVWEQAELDSKIGAMVKLGDYAYGSGDNNKYWFCVNWNTGEITYKDRTMSVGNIIAADGLLYCYSDKGEIALVKPNPEKFDIISKFPITMGTEQHWAHPVIYKGVLYVRHGDSLMAFKIK